MKTENRELPIRLLIVDDHPVVRAGLTTLLHAEPGLLVVGSAHSAEVALSLLKRHAIEVILLDLRMPKVSGIDLLQTLMKHPAPPAVIILSSFDYEEEIYRAVKLGAQGYLSKSASRAQIVAAISAVHAGKRWFPPRIAAQIAERESSSSLSPRELEILELVARGLTNKEIAGVLKISQFTVRNHVNHFSLKLDVSDRTEAVSVAVQQGIIDLSR